MSLRLLLAGGARPRDCRLRGGSALRRPPYAPPWRSRSPAPACSEFPADNWWHADVSQLPDARAQRRLALAHVDRRRPAPRLRAVVRRRAQLRHPDHGRRQEHKKVKVRFDYSSESDHVRYPLGRDTKIEGGRNSDGDRHAIIVDKVKCKLYETYATSEVRGTWHAGSGAVWSLKKNKLRPDGWTSADAAGLPDPAGAAALERGQAPTGSTTPSGSPPTTPPRSHLWPARHDAGSTDSLDYPPMGARFRLAASYDASGLSPYAQNVVAAMKKYGLVLADNGSPWFFQGEQNAEVARPADRGPQDHPGLGLRRRGHLVADGRPELRAGPLTRGWSTMFVMIAGTPLT